MPTKSFSDYCLQGNVHTQFLMQNVKMMFWVQPIHPPLKTSGVIKYIFWLKNVQHMYHRKRNVCKTYYTILWHRPTYYTITLSHQHRKYN